MRFVGVVGFGWYLLHFAVLGAVNDGPISNPQIKLVIATLGTALISWLAYRFVERPGISLGKRLASWQLAPGPTPSALTPAHSPREPLARADPTRIERA